MEQVDLDAPLPARLADALTEYRRVKELRLTMQREVDRVKERETALEDVLIEQIPKSGEGFVSGGYLARVVTKPKPQIVDWAPLTEAIKKSGRFDLLQKRLSEKAVMELIDDGFEVPGVGMFNVVSLSVTKVK